MPVRSQQAACVGRADRAVRPTSTIDLERLDDAFRPPPADLAGRTESARSSVALSSRPKRAAQPASSPSGGNSAAARSTIARSIGAAQIGNRQRRRQRSARAAPARRGPETPTALGRVVADRLERGRIVEPSRQAIVRVGAPAEAVSSRNGRCGGSERRRADCRSRRSRRRRSARAACRRSGALPWSVARPDGSTRPSRPPVARQARSRARQTAGSGWRGRPTARCRRRSRGVNRRPARSRHRALRPALGGSGVGRIMSHGGLPMTASNPASGRRAPFASKNTSGNSSSQ